MVAEPPSEAWPARKRSKLHRNCQPDNFLLLFFQMTRGKGVSTFGCRSMEGPLDTGEGCGSWSLGEARMSPCSRSVTFCIAALDLRDGQERERPRASSLRTSRSGSRLRRVPRGLDVGDECARRVAADPCVVLRPRSLSVLRLLQRARSAHVGSSPAVASGGRRLRIRMQRSDASARQWPLDKGGTGDEGPNPLHAHAANHRRPAGRRQAGTRGASGHILRLASSHRPE